MCFSVPQLFLAFKATPRKVQEPPGYGPSGMAVENSQAEKSRCVFCGLLYNSADGRQHGKHFRCSQCLSVDRTIRRHLGTTADLQDFDAEESKDFVKAMVTAKAADKHLQWRTVRASLIKKLAERQIKIYASQVEIEELPLSVLLQRGWTEDTVLRFESFESPEYGCTVFKVPIKKQTWKQVFESMEEKILEREKQASKKRGAQAADLDVPVEAGPSGGSKNEENDERKQANAEKKKKMANQKIATFAAKSLGSLTSAETALEKVTGKAETLADANQPALAVCTDSLAKVKRWAEAARMAVNQQESNKAKADGDSHVEMVPLPYDAADLKILLKQGQEGQKSLRASFPKPKAKAKTEKKETSDPPPKRRRGKAPA